MRIIRKHRKKAASKKAAKAHSVKVMVGRFGSTPSAVSIANNSTVIQVLQKAGIEVGGSERVWLNGERATRTEKVRAGDIISIVSPKQAGA